MIEKLVGATVALLVAAGSASAQHGGGGHGGGGGHYGGGYGGHGGYGRGYYGGIGFYGFGYGYGFGYPYPYYGGYYDLGGLGYSTFGGYGSGGGGIYPATPLVPYSSNYSPAPTPNLEPSSLPKLPAPLPLPPGPSSTESAGTATIAVVVPEGGQVWFDNTLTPKSGANWSFTSPKLEPGKTYIVNVKARWSENGKDRAYDIPMRVVSGDNMTMDLTKIR